MLKATGPMEKRNGCSCRRRFAARIGLGGTGVRFIRRYIRCVPYICGPPVWALAMSDALRTNNYFSGSQFGATSARISVDLLSCRCDWFAGQQAQPRFVTTYTYWSAGRTDTIACLPPHKPLDQSILQRMKSDNYHSAILPFPLSHSSSNSTLPIFEGELPPVSPIHD